jgi:hypothetical protein
MSDVTSPQRLIPLEPTASGAEAMKSKMFTKEFALVTFGATDASSGGYAVVQKPRPVIYHGITFIEGTISASAAHPMPVF